MWKLENDKSIIELVKNNIYIYYNIGKFIITDIKK